MKNFLKEKILISIFLKLNTLKKKLNNLLIIDTAIGKNIAQNK
jgi:hypothetical protein